MALFNLVLELRKLCLYYSKWKRKFLFPTYNNVTKISIQLNSFKNTIRYLRDITKIRCEKYRDIHYNICFLLYQKI